MKIKPMQDKTADFPKCYVKDLGDSKTVYCREHGAMLCVRKRELEGIWRCIQAINLSTGKCDNDCKAGCCSLSD